MYESNESSNVCMTINSIEQTPSAFYKIEATGSVFFARQDYLQNVLLENLYCGYELSSDDICELEDSTLKVATERAAMEYLNRCEHSRFKLTQKLKNKNFSSESIDAALDFLEKQNFLSDYRFAIAWLRSRRFTKSEGRTKLYGELLARGVCANIANKALDEFFEEFCEQDILKSAYEKLKTKNSTNEKMMEKLMQKGFSFSMVKEFLREKES